MPRRCLSKRKRRGYQIEVWKATIRIEIVSFALIYKWEGYSKTIVCCKIIFGESWKQTQAQAKQGKLLKWVQENRTWGGLKLSLIPLVKSCSPDIVISQRVVSLLRLFSHNHINTYENDMLLFQELIFEVEMAWWHDGDGGISLFVWLIVGQLHPLKSCIL